MSRGRLISLLLFIASAAFVVWRSSEVAVLVDFAYVVNIATRIAAGDVPYRDFPLAQAPLEFVLQAVLIKIFGPHYVVQIAYAAVMGGIATVLTFVITRRLLAPLSWADALGALLSLALVPLGVYAILPHPFYDSDACVLVLAGIALVLAARDRPTALRWIAAGAVLTVPLLMKQNIGGAFLALMVGALGVEALVRADQRRAFGTLAIGVAAGLAVEVVALQLIVGLDQFIQWTWTYALAGRGVTLQRLREFVDPPILLPGALLLMVTAAAQRLAPSGRAVAFAVGLGLFVVWLALAPTLLAAAPFYFPPILIAASVLALARAAREGVRFETLVPLVVTGTTLGTLQSQGLRDSSFGIFPLLVIGTASLVRDLAFFVDRPWRIAPLTGVALAVLLTVTGLVYTIGNVRLQFVDVGSGPIARSTFPSLAGLSARGPYVADLDALLFWARDNIPASDAVVFLPGEDPTFFALGWRPRLPSVYFYDVASPYSPEEIARFADQVDLRWVVVKDRLQLREEPPLEKALVALLTDRATLAATIGPYRVFKR